MAVSKRKRPSKLVTFAVNPPIPEACNATPVRRIGVPPLFTSEGIAGATLDDKRRGVDPKPADDRLAPNPVDDRLECPPLTAEDRRDELVLDRRVLVRLLSATAAAGGVKSGVCAYAESGPPCDGE